MRAALRRRAARAACWAIAAAALPLAARAHLAGRVDRELEPALSASLGAPLSIEGLDVTLTGLVRLTGISAGAALSVDAIEAAHDPVAIAGGDLTGGVIRLERPTIRLAAGGDRMWRRLRERLARGDRSAPGGPAGSGRVEVTGGELVIELGAATVRASAVELSPRPGGARLVAGPVEVEWRGRPIAARARFARAAIDLAGGAPRRLLALGGRLSAGGAGQDQLVLTDATLSAGLSDPPGELRLAGRVGEDDPGRLAIAVAVDRSGAVRGARGAIDALPLGFLQPLAAGAARLGTARATGTFAVSRTGGGLAGSAELAVEGLAVTHPLVSSAPVLLDGQASGRGSLRRMAGRRLLAIDRLELRRRTAWLELAGLLEWPAGGARLPERGALTAVLPETACAAALAAIPDGMRGALAGLQVEGALGGELALSFDRADPDATRLEVSTGIEGCRVLAEPALSDPRRLAAPFDLPLPGGGAVRVGDGPDHVPLARLPRHVSGAFVAAEDARFWRHQGFDPEQIERSLAIDIDSGRLLRGGSTISQQLVKNVYLGHERTLARKLQEAVLTWRVEARLDKRTILERYLDLIELGEGVRGVGAAARHWFGLPPARLGVRQAAFLAALTPAPRTLSRLVRLSGGAAPALAARVDTVLGAMRVARVIDRATYERALREPLRLSPGALGANP